MNKKTILNIVSILVFILLLRELLRFFSGDFVSSIIPGWHTTIYPTEWLLTIGAFVVVLFGFVLFGLFKGIRKILDWCWNQFHRKSSN